jgi:hypothetical protein
MYRSFPQENRLYRVFTLVFTLLGIRNLEDHLRMVANIGEQKIEQKSKLKNSQKF